MVFYLTQELIQNAEDAGARDVKFMYDKSQYDTDNLYHKDLDRFQVSLAKLDIVSEKILRRHTGNYGAIEVTQYIFLRNLFS